MKFKSTLPIFEKKIIKKEEGKSCLWECEGRIHFCDRKEEDGILKVWGAIARCQNSEWMKAYFDTISKE